MLKTIFKSLKNTDWKALTEFVSPVFFEVVPTLRMANVFVDIVKDYNSKAKSLEARELYMKNLSTPIGIKLSSPDNLPVALVRDDLSVEEKTLFGEKVLEIYFAQLFFSDVNILDLRFNTFSKDKYWSPKPIYYTWNPVFKDGIQKMYRGFYYDDQKIFLDGLRSLDLEHAADIFRNQFGSGAQKLVTFKLSDFKNSFHAIFSSCKKNKTKLHPDFFALGVYLLCVYENLEQLGVPLNVRKSFMAAEKLK